MSGIEVVGIILGALPLAIQLLRLYEGLARANSRLVKFGELYRKSLRDLEIEELLFRLIVETLVRPLVNDEMIDKDDLDRIINDASDSTWVDQDINKALGQRLGDAHSQFVQVAEDTKQLSIQLLKSIGFDNPEFQKRIFATQATNTGTSGRADTTLMSKARQAFVNFDFDFELERLKFASSKARQDSQKQLISRIHDNNQMLDKLLTFGGRVAALRENSAPRSSHSSLAKHVLQYWKHAQSIYDLLGRAWGCQCREQHCARLYLQHRTFPVFELCLMVMFSLSPSAAHPWREQDLKIEHLKSNNSVSLPVPTTPVAAAAAVPSLAVSGLGPAASSRPSSFRRLKKSLLQHLKKKVSIQAGPSPLHNTPTAIRTPLTPQLVPLVSNLSTDIQNMCKIMSTCGKKAECLGALRDGTSHHRYSVSMQPAGQASSDSITLRELLLNSTGRKIHRNQTYTIALAICLSHLQLQCTPWATEAWTASDINFPLENGLPLMERPYINAGFKILHPPSQSTTTIADRFFVCLGIVLLELCCRAPIEDCEWWQKLRLNDAQKSDPVFRFAVAGKWVDEVESEEGREMALAIKWCLHESPRVFLDEQWRRDLADKVVVPVQNCCRYLSGSI